MNWEVGERCILRGKALQFAEIEKWAVADVNYLFAEHERFKLKKASR
jgi:hypothetical protein